MSLYPWPVTTDDHTILLATRSAVNRWSIARLISSAIRQCHIVAFVACSLLAVSSPLCAQDNAPSADIEQAERVDSTADIPTAVDADVSPPSPDTTGLPDDEQLSLLELLIKGGWMMIPIGLASVLMVMVAIERTISLRRAKVLPRSLVDGLALANLKRGSFDPRRAYKLCYAHPSAASNVIRAMLLKVGRPHAEVERAVQEASQREADRLYANVRWLNFIAGVTPLLGLLGTVWGMIQTFHGSTLLSPMDNKATFLASGIYVALVTTLGGLTVAIPAAVLAHHFEGKIQTIFHRIDELLFQLLPHVERYEGKLRVDHQTLMESEKSNSVTTQSSAASPPQATVRSSRT